MLTFGNVLPNGATVIQVARRPDGATYVLARWREEYVTWRVNPNLSTAHGEYFSHNAQGLMEAAASLVRRTSN